MNGRAGAACAAVSGGIGGPAKSRMPPQAKLSVPAAPRKKLRREETVPTFPTLDRQPLAITRPPLGSHFPYESWIRSSANLSQCPEVPLPVNARYRRNTKCEPRD